MSLKRAFAGIVLLAAGVTAYVLSAGAFRRAEPPPTASGTIEARNIRVGSKVGGRIVDVRVREGDRVEAGQTLVVFDEKELRAALDQARANLQKVEGGFRPEEIAEAAAAVAQASADYDLKRSGSRKEDIEAARADVERARAASLLAQRNFKRVTDLVDAGIFPVNKRDDVDADTKMTAADQRSAEERLALLERGFRPEEIASVAARYRQAQATHAKLQRGNRREDIELARAQLQDAEARYRERQVLAPAVASVETLDVRPGDLIAPNTPIATLLESDQIYVRIYIPETSFGDVHLHQKAELRVDPFPGEVFEAEVEQINQKAEFLPRNVQTRAERVHQVFGVKLRIQDPGGRLRAGMAADVKLKP